MGMSISVPEKLWTFTLAQGGGPYFLLLLSATSKRFTFTYLRISIVLTKIKR